MFEKLINLSFNNHIYFPNETYAANTHKIFTIFKDLDTVSQFRTTLCDNEEQVGNYFS